MFWSGIRKIEFRYCVSILYEVLGFWDGFSNVFPIFVKKLLKWLDISDGTFESVRLILIFSTVALFFSFIQRDLQPPALQREYPALQISKILKIIECLNSYLLLDPDPESEFVSGSAYTNENNKVKRSYPFSLNNMFFLCGPSKMCILLYCTTNFCILCTLYTHAKK